jgi:tetratricopeptide (TPR) repeat protein
MPKKTSVRKLSREEKRNLDVEISFIEGIVRRDPAYIEALQILGDDYTRRGRFVDGLKVDEQLAGLRPEDPTVLYNLACSYSLTGETELAFAALHRALAAGYSDFKWLAQDPDLENLRKHPDYAAIRNKIKALKPKTRAA